MANHKKRRAPNARAGCKLCRRWKITGVPQHQYAPNERRRLQESYREHEGRAPREAAEEAEVCSHQAS